MYTHTHIHIYSGTTLSGHLTLPDILTLVDTFKWHRNFCI